MTEPTITINGKSLTIGQSVTLHVALTSFIFDMEEPNALGPDERGESIRILYQKNASQIQSLMHSQYDHNTQA